MERARGIVLALSLAGAAACAAPRAATSRPTRPAATAAAPRLDLPAGRVVADAVGESLVLPGAPDHRLWLPKLRHQRCAHAVAAGGRWISARGPLGARVQLGATSAAVGKGAGPDAVLWQHDKRQGCWVRQPLFALPEGKPAATIAWTPKAKRASTARLTWAGQPMVVSLGKPRKSGVTATVTLQRAGKPWLTYDYVVDADRFTKLPAGIDAARRATLDVDVCPSDSASVRLELYRVAGALSALISCSADGSLERRVLRLSLKRDGASRLETVTRESWVKRRDVSDCDTCNLVLEHLLRQRFLAHGSSLTYRDENVHGDDVDSCEWDCLACTQKKGAARRACEVSCRDDEQKAAASADKACAARRAATRRWDVTVIGVGGRKTLTVLSLRK